MEMRRFIQAGAILAEDFSSNNTKQDLARRGYTITGNPQQGSNGLTFDGTNDYMNLPNPINQSPALLTIVMKVKPNWNSSDAGGHYFFDTTNDNGRYLLYKEITSNKHGIYIGGNRLGNVLFSELTYSADDEFYLFLTVDTTNNECKLYKDTTLLKTWTTPITARLNDRLYLGSRYTGTDKFDGDFQKFMIFPRLLSTQEITDIVNDTTWDYDKYLVNKWDMSQTGTVKDLIGYNDGISGNMNDSNIVNGINGKSKALSFNGTDEKVSFDIVPTITITSSYSIISVGSAVDTDPVDANTLWSQSISGSDRHGCIIINNIFRVGVFDGSTYIAKKSGSVVANKRYIFGVSFDTNDLNLYFDGVEQTGTEQPYLSSIAYNFRIGSASGGISKFWDGEVDTTLIYKDIALTEIQHKDITNRIMTGRI